MSEHTYHVEFAKSGRSNCKKCKTKIEKGQVRLADSVEPPEHSDGFAVTSYFHPTCFTLPRKWNTGAQKKTAAEFVDDVLRDSTNGEILPAQRDDLIAWIEMKAPASNKTNSGGGDDIATILAHYKAAYEAKQQHGGDGDDDDDDAPAKKKQKTKGGPQKKEPASSALDAPPLDAAMVDAYGVYAKYKNDELKECLKWNRQFVTGSKPYLMYKVMDGHVRGRLGRCSVCDGGQLKLSETNGLTVTCNGSFDEATQMRMTCSYQAAVTEAPRWQPWYTVEPTEKENEEIDRLIAEAKGEEVGGKDGAAVNPNVEALQKAVLLQMKNAEWSLADKQGIRAATEDLIQALRAVDGLQLDIPDDEVQAKQKIGQIVVRDRQAKVQDVIPILVQEFGFAEAKKAKAAKKETALAASLKNPKNGPVVAVMQELAQFYFKESNTNAGVSYNKVVAALQSLEFEVTAENVMGLSKGKTKVPNIGKSSAEKMREFLQTGKIEKLEEKRAAAM